MGKKRNTAEQIIRDLRDADLEWAKGQTTSDVVRELGITADALLTGRSGRCWGGYSAR